MMRKQSVSASKNSLIRQYRELAHLVTRLCVILWLAVQYHVQSSLAQSSHAQSRTAQENRSVTSTVEQEAKARVDFQSDVRPILSNACFQCHGPDENTREADLRLDDPADAASDRGGYRVINSESPADSELIVRILSEDPDIRMPPDDSNKSLSAEDRQILIRWVEQGGQYEEHWAFESPVQKAPPQAARNQEWIANPIDAYVLAKLHAAGLNPNEIADRPTLARRVCLDLTGLPPTPEQTFQFLNDDRPDAYERYVERLLASPQYGERWARRWLDLARYSDTNGYEKDKPRSIWPYRDWVIHALNADMPYDQFSVEQLAGDMLPNATQSQKIATGFHRNTMTNEEGGVDPQEFRFLSVIDRVSTTGTVWLGLTVGCAQCHSHKFDPISQEEYYGIFAFLNNADEPMMDVIDSEIETERQSVLSRIDALEADLPNKFPPGALTDEPSEIFERSFQEWLNSQVGTVNHWTIQTPSKIESNLPIVTLLDDSSVLATGDVTKADRFTVTYPASASPITAVRLEVLADPRLPYGGPGRSSIQAGVEKGGDFYLSDFELTLVGSTQNASVSDSNDVDDLIRNRANFAAASHSFSGPKRSAMDAIDDKADTGWGVAGRTAQNHWAVFTLDEPIVAGDDHLEFVLAHRSFYPSGLGRFRISYTSDETIHEATDRPAAINDLLSVGREELKAEQIETLRRYFARTCPQLADARRPIDALRASMPKRPTTLTMQERDSIHHRETKRHHRGEYLQAREPVSEMVPSILHDFNATDQPNRLDFARWLVDPSNPLTARVTANRQWQAFFGRGLVVTVEDFGYQGASPTHPELLDWLAIELMENDWSIKHLHRLIVTSNTYRQSAKVSEVKLEVDPTNELLSRSPRVRLDAEQIRDSVLTSAGLLSRRLGGPSVFPPQPPGITEASYGPMAWNVSSGEDRFRRGIYTFNKRTAPYAMFGIFDGPSGESCVPRRIPSNTPIQALTMLNDSFLIEASRELARTLLDEQHASDESIVHALFVRCFAREPSKRELASVTSFMSRQRTRLREATVEAHRISASGTIELWAFDVPFGKATEHHRNANEVSELAVLTLTCRAIFNLDEMINKP